MGYGSSIGTGAAIGSAVPGVGTAIGAGVGALAQFLSGFFGGKRKADDEKKRAAEADAAARRAWDQNEIARIARLKSLLSAGGARGINTGTMDPALLTPRPYPGPNTTVGMRGPSFWNSLLGFAGDTALGYAQSRDSGGGPGSIIGNSSPMSGRTEDPLVDGLLQSQAPQGGGGSPMHGTGGGFYDDEDYSRSPRI
jgi:hypothetical protein